MKQPEVVLPAGTRIVTHEVLESTTGMIVHPKHIKARRPNMHEVIGGWVPGHGGDVYWCQTREDGECAVYCFTEFELDKD